MMKTISAWDELKRQEISACTKMIVDTCKVELDTVIEAMETLGLADGVRRLREASQKIDSKAREILKIIKG